MSPHRILVAGLLTATIGNALVSGVFLAFSSFIMPALARVSPESGVSVMQSINITVIRSLFLRLFFLTTLVSAMLVFAPAARVPGPASWIACVAGVVSVAGAFGVTMWLNVPLNDALAAATPGSPAGGALWSAYLRDWTTANHVRTAASAIASALFLAALLLMRSES